MSELLPESDDLTAAYTCGLKAGQEDAKSFMNKLANIVIEHGLAKPVEPRWNCCENELLPPADKIVILKLESGEEILGGIGASGDDFPWCRAYGIEWDKDKQRLTCIDFIESDIEPTHWREV